MILTTPDNREMDVNEIDYKKYSVRFDNLELTLGEAELGVLLCAHGFCYLSQIYYFLNQKGLTKTRYTIPVVNWDRFEERMMELNKKCVKIGATPVSYKVHEHLLEKKNMYGEVIQHESFVVTIDGVSPRFKGWEFVATIEHTDNGNIIRSIKEVPESFRNVEPHCEHCKSKRTRRDTFILQDENGYYAQIGRSCIRDFLGHVSPEHIAAIESFIHSIRSQEVPEYGRVKQHTSLEAFSVYCAQLILNEGYVSKNNKFGKTPTGARAFGEMNETDKTKKISLSQKADEIAKKAIEWNKERIGQDQFGHNMKMVFQKDIIHMRDFGFVSFGIFEYMKNQGELPEKEKKKPSEFVGIVGERIEFKNILVQSKNEFDGHYQAKFYIYVLKDESNNTIVWKTANAALEMLSRIDFKATVKAHTIWKDQKQTEVSRLKVIQTKE